MDIRRTSLGFCQSGAHVPSGSVQDSSWFGGFCSKRGPDYNQRGVWHISTRGRRESADCFAGFDSIKYTWLIIAVHSIRRWKAVNYLLGTMLLGSERLRCYTYGRQADSTGAASF